MVDKQKHPINDAWEEYYKTLEEIRRSGICNMWGANTYLKDSHPELSHDEAKAVLLSWITNYTELSQRFGWR